MLRRGQWRRTRARPAADDAAGKPHCPDRLGLDERLRPPSRRSSRRRSALPRETAPSFHLARDRRKRRPIQQTAAEFDERLILRVDVRTIQPTEPRHCLCVIRYQDRGDRFRIAQFPRNTPQVRIDLLGFAVLALQFLDEGSFLWLQSGRQPREDAFFLVGSVPGAVGVEKPQAGFQRFQGFLLLS